MFAHFGVKNRAIGWHRWKALSFGVRDGARVTLTNFFADFRIPCDKYFCSRRNSHSHLPAANAARIFPKGLYASVTGHEVLQTVCQSSARSWRRHLKCSSWYKVSSRSLLVGLIFTLLVL